MEVTDEVAILGAFIKAEIQEMGQRKRYQIIERWYKARNGHDKNENFFRNKIEQTRAEIDRILITHIVPRTPLIVLILLKAIDNSQSGDLAQSGYVRYYKFLIDNAILRNFQIAEAELAYALLPELAWATYNTEAKELLPEEAERIVDSFAERRALRKTTLYSVLESLRRIGMFNGNTTLYRFRHPYAYNSFLADYMSQNLVHNYMRDHVRQLCEESWSRQTATILIFLSFHSNNSIVIEHLISRLKMSYQHSQPFDFFDARAQAINTLITNLPREVIDYSKAREG